MYYHFCLSLVTVTADFPVLMIVFIQ